MSLDDTSIAKFQVRFRVQTGRSENSAELSLDSQIVKHLRMLQSLGGNAEWLRNAIRNQYVRERSTVESSENVNA